MKKTTALIGLIVSLGFFLAVSAWALMEPSEYEYPDTKDLVSLVNDAAGLVESNGEAAFPEFKKEGSLWRRGDTYVFVLDPEGNMVMHPDPALEGKNQLGLKDVNGKPIIKGLIREVTGYEHKKEGWYHYQWPEPGNIFPSWKTTYVKLASAPSGKKYMVCCGLYNMKMERKFVADMVREAVEQIEKNGRESFKLLRNPAGEFIFKDTYIFVMNSAGKELVNPGFPNLEGRNMLDLKDTRGKLLNREMLHVVETKGSGWVDYMWPKPGEYISTEKSSYVSKAKLGDSWIAVGCGVYLVGASQEAPTAETMDAEAVVELVRDAAALLEKEGEGAFPEFRKKGSKWFHDDTYLFVWNIKGVRVFHAADPKGEGKHVAGLEDVSGRPIGRMFLGVASSESGEGWLHYLWPKPGDIFPTWKSAFLKRVTFPSGKECLVGCGIYNMKIEKEFIVHTVNAAAALIEKKGRAAFKVIRDKNGPFIFLDTYVFVDTPEGVEVVNPAFPNVEGKNLMKFKDAEGRYVVREYINAALNKGSAWVDYLWPKPSETTPSRKHTYVRKVRHGDETFIVGSGAYLD